MVYERVCAWLCVVAGMQQQGMLAQAKDVAARIRTDMLPLYRTSPPCQQQPDPCELSADYIAALQCMLAGHELVNRAKRDTAQAGAVGMLLRGAGLLGRAAQALPHVAQLAKARDKARAFGLLVLSRQVQEQDCGVAECLAGMAVALLRGAGQPAGTAERQRDELARLNTTVYGCMRVPEAKDIRLAPNAGNNSNSICIRHDEHGLVHLGAMLAPIPPGIRASRE